MYTTLVTIGRNVGATPMSGDEWQAFKRSVLDLLMALAWRTAEGTSEGWYLSDSEGRGFWDGLAEDNYTVTLIHENRFTPANYEEMRNELKILAARYRQDAIALIGEVQADLVPAS